MAFVIVVTDEEDYGNFNPIEFLEDVEILTESILNDYVDELVMLYKDNPNGFDLDSDNYQIIKNIGIKLNKIGGFELMLQAHKMFSNRLKMPGADRNLEIIWHGIGCWLG